MPGFVADASATLPWCFEVEEEATPATEALLERLRAGEPAVVPAHWSTEVMNGLIMAVRRGRIDLERVARFARELGIPFTQPTPTYCASRLCFGLMHVILFSMLFLRHCFIRFQPLKRDLPCPYSQSEMTKGTS
jgi:hypothetical protein